MSGVMNPASDIGRHISDSAAAATVQNQLTMATAKGIKVLEYVVPVPDKHVPIQLVRSNSRATMSQHLLASVVEY